MFDQQSQELNPKKRLEMVIAIQKKLEQDAARPVLAQRLDYYAHWPHVKGLVAAAQHLQLRPLPGRVEGQVSAAAASVKTYVAQRLGIAVLTLVGHVDGDLRPAAPGPGGHRRRAVLGRRLRDDKERAAILKELGLDKPVWAQYVDWVRQIVTGDLGKSYRYDAAGVGGHPAADPGDARARGPVDAGRGGARRAARRGQRGPPGRARSTTSLRVFSLAGLSMPSFWLGMVIILGCVVVAPAGSRR